MAGVQMRVKEGAELGKLLTVGAELLIGRSAPEEAGRLGGDLEISRRHAQVTRDDGGGLSIVDLGSANGTFVNDARIEAPYELEVGDVVRIGKTVLEVVGGAEVGPKESDVPEILVVSAGTGLGRQLSVGDELLIGRAVSGAGLLADDPELSRRHARIARDADELLIEDLGSANGTFVNGERVEGRRVLKVGDSVRVGSTTFDVVAAGRSHLQPAPPAPPEPPAQLQPPAPRVAPVHAPLPAPVVPTGELASNLPPGSVFAGCRIEEVIGHGDMGVVYRADELALQRPVALKLILPGYSDDERFRERFRRESKIAAAIDHPNVIPVFDAGEEHGVLYIMMRLVEGTDLRALIAAEGGLEPLRAARIVRQVGAALDAAHARGMLHRDVKPSNVLLARRDHVYLTDFGLAKPAASMEALTRHGTVVARAEYVAPEQVLNEAVDARADIYALGCLLFETLTGEPPFASSSAAVGPLAHVDAPRPSPHDVRPDVPPVFDEIVQRAMAKDPAERYPSAGDLGQAALVAAGGLRRARPWSMVATGEAAFMRGAPARSDAAAESGAAAGAAAVAVAEPAESPDVAARDGAGTGRPDVLKWAVALAALVVVAVGMVAALHGISTL